MGKLYLYGIGLKMTKLDHVVDTITCAKRHHDPIFFYGFCVRWIAFDRVNLVATHVRNVKTTLLYSLINVVFCYFDLINLIFMSHFILFIDVMHHEFCWKAGTRSVGSVSCSYQFFIRNLFFFFFVTGLIMVLCIWQ